MSKPTPSFATPLVQSTRSDILEWRFPKPYHQYVLTGKSRAAWHTSFVIPQLNLLLDAGLVVNNLRPKQVLVTHGHIDHCGSVPVFIKREDPPDIICPVEIKKALDNYALAKTLLNRGGLYTTDDAAAVGLPLDGKGVDEDGRTEGERAFLATHHTIAVRDGEVVPLKRLKNMDALVFRCDHNVPSVGYVIRQTTHRLKPEYTALPGPELKALRQSGVDLTAPVVTPVFAFCGDTTAATLAAEPEWLRQGIPVVITECSFLYDEHDAQAEKTKHTKWKDLEKVVRKWPETTFILIHFSMRYSNKDVVGFFKGLEDPPANIVVWADGEPE
ncbi:tRNase Z TRZ1 [Colletotrichum orbiculare MAFF 240422]|uniref:TRNase Z TRZ1 n=1 Tax=Colletotrichum orbiculare (strain 104-T / ATCC 96160 / CBS 514.97 / LARS 414 / MAFF 240422) TaxID=1213857 RepID=N4VHK4_COLOR|nr:tRNase Z TRZ1 [Colletotrichum orbiculare MAFF 240422]